MSGQRTKIITLNPSFNANQGVGVYNTDFAMEDGYTRLTGIAVINTAAHTNYDIGINDHSNNTKLDPADVSFWSPGQNGDQKFIPVDIALNGGNKLIVVTNVRVQEANAIGYQVIAQIEKA